MVPRKSQVFKRLWVQISLIAALSLSFFKCFPFFKISSAPFIIFLFFIFIFFMYITYFFSIFSCRLCSLIFKNFLVHLFIQKKKCIRVQFLDTLREISGYATGCFQSALISSKYRCRFMWRCLIRHKIKEKNKHFYNMWSKQTFEIFRHINQNFKSKINCLGSNCFHSFWKLEKNQIYRHIIRNNDSAVIVVTIIVEYSMMFLEMTHWIVPTVHS